LSFKNDVTCNIHQTVGRASFSEIQIKENANAFIEAVKKLKPSSSKGIYILSATLVSTMGPAIHLEVAQQ